MMSSVVTNWSVMHDSFQWILSQSFKVQVAHFHDDFEGNEMNDAMLDSVLISKHVDANAFTEKSTEYLIQT